MLNRTTNSSKTDAGNVPIGAGGQSGHDEVSVTRREILRFSGQLATALVAVQASGILLKNGWIGAARADTESLPSAQVLDAFGGLTAFVVPGPDSFSTGQGVSTTEPGGVHPVVVGGLIQAFNAAVPPDTTTTPPTFGAEIVALALDGISGFQYPGTTGPFESVFANLAFEQKVGVFAAMDSIESLAPLSASLTQFVAATVYSEVTGFDFINRELIGQPVGWTLSDYTGVADGRDEFLGYFANRKKAETDSPDGQE